MSGIRTTRIGLPTGVTLKVQLGGREGAAPIFLLHGFPESHRTWRHQLPNFARDFQVVAPDQRGFGGSDKPQEIDAYKTDRIVEDLMALADALGIAAFTLVGHDWGGAASWLAALRHPRRVERLVIVNAPHPLIFQKSVIEDEAQRAASQYINRFRDPSMERLIEAMGLETFFEKSFGAHVDLRLIPDAERRAYLDDWAQPGALTAMLNWYRASNLEVPEVGASARKPLWTHAPFPKLKMPVLVIWGIKDKALLPVQLDGLHDLVDDLRLVIEPDAGHFVPWEKPEVVTEAIREFMAETSG
ncbi:MAG TPA: alpha/beta hydrolase [Allosphingosinicella sp.]|nr:alpha/beta hydrolase [Allosphingosinicella sp.]